MRSARHLTTALLLLALLVSLLPVSPTAAAGTIAVTTFNDTFQNSQVSGGPCSLREAIAAANRGVAVDGCPAGHPNGTTITLAAGTYTLSLTGAGEDNDATGDLDVTHTLTITGAGQGQTVVTAATGFTDRLLQVLSTGNLTLQDLTLSGGNVSGDGGAVLSDGRLTLNSVEVTAGAASGNGGGIASDGPALTVTNSIIRGNQAPNGGGLFLSGTTATVARSAIVGNTAGPGAASGNNNGGGVYASRSSVLALSSSTISDNSAASDGGGFFNASAQSSNDNTVTLTNVTLTANKAGRNAGGLDNFGVATLLNTVVAGNSAGSSADCLNAPGHQVQSSGYNLIGIIDGCSLTGTLTGNKIGTAAAPLDPKLGPLGNYGGPNPTLAHRQLAGSPVIDAGTNAGCPALDQRGVQRTGPGTGSACDMGAIELSRLVTAVDNTSWPRALPIATGTPISTNSLDLQGQSRWYKFHVDPTEQITVTLTNLPANYDLTLYKDIGAAFNAQLSLSSPQDLVQLSAEFAPDAFTPDAFTPDAFSPDAFTPDAFTPDAFTPDAFTQDVFAPDAFTPDAFTPDAFTPDAFTPDAFTPDAYTPDAFTPDAYTPDAFTPDAFTPADYSSAQTRSLIGASAFNGTVSEGIRVNTWDLSGNFYIRVRGRNGAFDPGAKFTVEADVTAVGCDPAVLAAANALPGSNPPAIAAGKQTLILVDSTRMSGDGTTSFASLLTKLNSFAGLSSVNGAVVDVSQDPRVAAANQLAVQGTNATCPYLKNVVAGSITAIVDRYRQLNPSSLRYLVIVGNDDVIPFFRYPDESLLASEQDFVPPVKDSSASQASLRDGYVLSQDRYGASINLSRNITTLPVPDLPVGRLVETTSEVSTMLDAYMLHTSNGVITPSNALVTGYDFLADDAQAVQSSLTTGLGAGSAVSTLITPASVSPQSNLPYASGGPWTAADLSAALLGARHDLVFLAGHFSPASTLAADYRTRLLTSDLLASTLDLTNEIIFSAGCHSGYNTVDAAAIPSVTPQPDWAQAAAEKGITLIAGTGYQYGDTDFIKYSEQLYLNFADQLRAGSGPVSLGQALVAAKQQYLGQTMQLTGIDQKAFLEATLFGLPMLSVNMPAGRGSSTPPSIVSGTQLVGSNPGQTLGLNYADISRDFSPTPVNVTMSDVGNPTSTHTATYYLGRDGVVSNPFQPVLPLQRDSVAVPGQVVRGVGFRAGTYQDHGDVLPLTGAATADLRGVHAAFQTSTFFPTAPWSLNYFDQLAGSGPPWLQLTPAQFQQSSPSSATGTMRVYSQMDFRLFYSNNIATYPSTGTYPTTGDIPALAASPAITHVAAAQAGGTINFAVNAVGDPTAGVQTVWITYTLPPGPDGVGHWVSVDLHQSEADSTLWQASLSGIANPSGLRYIVQAANGAGLVTLATNMGAYYSLNDGLGSTPTMLSFTTLPSGGPYGTTVTVAARLTANGTPLTGQTIFFGIGAQRYAAITDANGVASAGLQLLASPGSTTISASFNGTTVYSPSGASSGFSISKQSTSLALGPVTSPYNSPATLVATLADATGRPLGLRTVVFTVDGTPSVTAPPVHQVVSAISDAQGQATLGPLNLPPGSYVIDATFASQVTLPDSSTLTMTDDRYLPASASTTLTVSAATTTVTYTGDTVAVAGSPINLSATVTQSGGATADLTLAQVQFAVSDGSGASVQNLTVPVTSSGTASTSITLNTPDIYTVQVSVVGGYFSSPTITIFIDNYALTSGSTSTLVTGGGWINVAAGAYQPNPTAAGRANFGFNATLPKKGSPSGKLEFNFSVGGLNFKSTGVSSLTVKNGTATVTGSGTVNGATGYSYTLTVVDGGSNGTDSIRIQVKQGTTTVFDNGSNQPLGGGNIVIH